MENTLGQRIRKLRLFYKIGIREFSNTCGLSFLAILNLERGVTSNPHLSSLKKIAKAYNTTMEWLSEGKGEMLPGGPREFHAPEHDHNGGSYISKEAYLEMKNKNIILEKEVERLWMMLSHLTDTPRADSKKN